MYAFQKEIAKRETNSPVCSYPYKVVPLTDQAKFAFAMFNKHRGPVLNRKELFQKFLNLDKPPFVGQKSFFYDDSNESEESRKLETKELAIFNMAERWVPGIKHMNSGRRTYYQTLEYGVDYKVEVGDKIVHKQPVPLTFDDIKAL